MTVNYEKKTAAVDFDPSVALVEQMIASLAKKKKFSARLCMPVQSAQDVGGGTWSVATEHESYAPEGKGKLLAHFEPAGGSVSDVKIEWKADASVKIDNPTLQSAEEVTTSTDYATELEIAKDVKKTQLLVRVTITYQMKVAKGAKTAGKVELPAVVLIEQ